MATPSNVHKTLTSLLGAGWVIKREISLTAEHGSYIPNAVVQFHYLVLGY